MVMMPLHRTDEIMVPTEAGDLPGFLELPDATSGLVLFAHGSGSSRFSRRNRAVAQALNRGGIGTLLLDLLTPDEHARDQRTAEHRFDIPLLTRRLVHAVDWAAADARTEHLAIGAFGASTGSAAALGAAALRPQQVRAVVSRGGRPDLAVDVLDDVRQPTLLIVGGLDETVLELNREAAARMPNPAQIEVIPGASHLFEEPGKLEAVSALARDFFRAHLGSAA